MYRVVFDHDDSDDSMDSVEDNIYEIECSLLMRQSNENKTEYKDATAEEREEFGGSSP